MKYKKIAAILTVTVLLNTITMAFADTPFNDIDKNWAKANIINVYEKGLMNGTSADKFSPDTAVNKYSAIISISRMMGTNNMDLNDLVEKQKEVLDKYKVPEYAWKEIAFSLEKGIIQGEIEMDKFSTQTQATKLDICVYLGRAFGVQLDTTKPPVVLSYTDALSIPSMYRIYVNHMIKIDVVDGKGDSEGLFRPDMPVTRAMFAKMLDAASAEYVKTIVTSDTPVESVQSGNSQTQVQTGENTTTKPIDSTVTAKVKDKGIIDSIIYTRASQPRILLENENKTLVEYTIPVDTIKENVIINGQLSDVYSLRPGFYVEVEVMAGIIGKISTIDMTKAVDAKGIIKQLDVVSASMIVDIYDDQNGIVEEKKVFLHDAKIGDVSFNLLSMDALSPGQSIYLIGIEDMEGIRASSIMIKQ